MPKVKIEKTTSMSRQESYEKVKAFLKDDEGLRKLDSGYLCHFEDDSLSGTAKGSKFTANMTISGEDGSTKVEIVVELPIMLTPFTGTVKSIIEKKLNKVLDA